MSERDITVEEVEAAIRQVVAGVPEPHVMDVSEFDYYRPETYEGSYSRLSEPSVMLKRAERDVAFLATAHRQLAAEAVALRETIENALYELRWAVDPYKAPEQVDQFVRNALRILSTHDARAETQ